MMLFDPLLLQYCCTHSAGKALLPKTATESSLLVHFGCTSPIVCCDMLLAMLATSEHSSYVVVPTLDMPTIEGVGVCRQITYFLQKTVPKFQPGDTPTSKHLPVCMLWWTHMKCQ